MHFKYLIDRNFSTIEIMNKSLTAVSPLAQLLCVQVRNGDDFFTAEISQMSGCGEFNWSKGIN